MKKKLLFLVSVINVCLYAQQGKVGINTENPSATLDIVSKANTNATKALKISNSSSAEMVTVRDNGQVGINQASPATDALLELNATNKALLLTRVTNATDVANPVNGMLVYDITQNCVRGYENSAWSGCLSSGGGGGGGGITTFGSDGLLCDSNAFVNPISAGLQAARAEGASSIDYNVTEEGIILDASGKKFYTQSANFFWDLDVNNLYASAGLTDQATSIEYKFPAYYSTNTSGHWTEMKIFGQLYPTKTWKQFSTSASHKYDGVGAHVYPDYWALLLSTDGELKAVRYQKRGAYWGFIYPGVTGREGVGKSLATITTDMNPTDFFAATDIKAYSDVNTPTATNWSWFEPYMNGYFSNYSSEYISAVLAYNAADNLFYTWGAKDGVGSQTVYNAFSNILLRTNPANITASMTPLPATILNNLLINLGTTVKVPTNEHSTIIISKRTSDTRPTLNFITADNRVIRYNLDNNNYISLSLPAGVNPVSIQRNDITGNEISADILFILGSDGKLYTTTTTASAVAQTGNITAFAHTAFASAGYPKIKQYTKGIFIDENGLLGRFQSGGAITFPAEKQTVAIERILQPFANPSSHSNLFVDTNKNFGEYNNYWGSGPKYNKFGYVAGKIANYLFNRQNNWVAPDRIESFQFYPSKCTTY